MNSARIVAKELLQINAIKLNAQNPFTWASGLRSPIYCDNRIILSFPNARSTVTKLMVEAIQSSGLKPDVIAGVATSGIAFGALVAEAMDLPFIYVRSSAKKHGRQQKIEGQFKEGQSAVVIEDLISTGSSCLEAVHSLREEKINILSVHAIFTYRFDLSHKNFTEANCNYHCLSDYPNLLEEVLESGSMKTEEIQQLKSWNQDPVQWSESFTQRQNQN